MKRHIGSFSVAITVLATSVASAQGLTTGTSATSAFGTGTRTLGQGIQAPLGTGQTGAPGSMVEQMNTTAGQVTGNERFIQDNRQPGAFVGADTGEIQNVRSQATGQGRGGQTGLTQLNNIFSQFGQGGAGRGGAQQTTRRTLRAPIRLGFVSPRISTVAIGRRLTESVTRMPAFRDSEGITVTVEGRTAVLQGVVDSQQQADLLARIARLEPGVNNVVNELQITPATLPAPQQ